MLLRLIDRATDRGGEFVRRRVEVGDPGFVQMWAAMGGQARFDRRRRWWSEHRRQFEKQLIGSRHSGA